MVIVHVCMLNLLSVLFSYNQPRWLVYSKYRLLKYLYLFAYISVFLCFFSLYEAQFSTMSRTSTFLYRHYPKRNPEMLSDFFYSDHWLNISFAFFQRKGFRNPRSRKTLLISNLSALSIQCNFCFAVFGFRRFLYKLVLCDFF